MQKSTLAELYDTHDSVPVCDSRYLTEAGLVEREMRYPAKVPAHIFMANSTFLNGFLVNRSTDGGCFSLDSEACLRVGDRIHVRIAQENTARRAVVIWREARDIGVAFIRD